ncbi:type I DNA topoisomerase [Rhodopseudomonas palustris]|uniref:DNA topoisomerase 1 n=1 Tax=Rhodopseudomonas palustris (strain ATCC BAA-98 / CGA009) TaxID=258594 RepID=Q6N559_RHOPA|nr:type I DNA topoisomerase [Rhodopseudomonas palustris]OPF93706.1 DNA topoisomerase I [Rhodopseudomonas palustris]PPQ45180.1 DNA topoisomerase I [Rhodopseudomonas palustris]QQM04657.1 DNA topoisomerase 1 [Rhodopseudomonas palustris]RJF66389.1 type I DNA topoisomerase [Rhodopseudomonas palustris]WAB76033.1 type I DNA topoisomerase [Rhodopseudomonas palustris]
MNLVIVESPAKAKTINKYLGSSYEVLASFGHVRDLPAKNGSVDPDADFQMIWEVDPKAASRLNDIAKALKGADKLILATDPDREGEAISWHVLEVMKQKRALKDQQVERVVFNAITKQSVTDAMKHPRQIDGALVDAYMARRALDYLVGFTLSPVLWRKLPGARSAGRVQSVALRLVCDRETEIEKFVPREYWSLIATMATPRGETFEARLVGADGKKIQRLDIGTGAEAEDFKKAIEAANFRVATVEAKPARRNPYAPFTTSTLQQEASRKLGFAPAHTMRVAQRLYEGVDIGGETVGLITYMRTDGVQIDSSAITQARKVIAEDFGNAYVPDAPRQYTAKAKNAQEAHEAIRPTDLSRRPSDVSRNLDSDQARLYELIWIRTVASQMESAELERTTVDIEAKAGSRVLELRATGQVVKFDGFLAAYQEGRDDDSEDEDSRRLPAMSENEALKREALAVTQHFTEPPPRFSEASLVKRMEELGIGRPSTYASILQVLKDRGYVRLEKKRLHGEDKGRVVVAFLESFFTRYVEYDFTAGLEEDLDRISNNEVSWKQVLSDFWRDFIGAVDEIKDLRVAQVLDVLDEMLGPHIYPAREDGGDPRQCPSCGTGKLNLKAGKFGAFVGCSNYPECRYTRPLASDSAGDADRVLGTDPDSGLEVAVKSGRFGPYIQLGEAKDYAEGEKPKRAGIPKGTSPSDVDLEMALKLLALPREVGKHPETGQPIKAGIGRFGPYVQHEKTYASLEAGDDVHTIGLNRAVTLIAEKVAKGPSKGRFGSDPGKALGDHPSLGAVAVKKGRYGAYVTAGGVNATIPNDKTEDTITLPEAIALLDERAAKGGGKAKKAPAKKAAAKKASADGEAKPVKKAAAKKAKPKAEGAAASKARAPVAAKTAAKKAAKPKDAAKSSAAKNG